MTNRNRIRLAFAGLLALNAAATGCDEFAQAVENAAAAENPGTEAEAQAQAGEPELTPDDLLGDKLSGYIDCINRTSRYVGDAADRYASYVDRDEGPTKKKVGTSTIYDIGDVTSCVEGLKKSNDAEPHIDELDAAGKAYLAALETISPLNASAHAYYDEENFKDDELAKGKELHPKLIAGFDAFLAADQALRAEVAKHNDGLQERALARVEKEQGRKLLWQTKNVMAQAKKLLEHTQKEFDQLDLEALGTAVEAYSAAVDECEKYAKDNEKEANSVTMYSSFVSDAVELKKQVKTLMRRKRDEEPWTKKELMYQQRHHIDPDGHPAQISEHYNDLVSQSNGLNWHWYEPNPA